MTDDREQIIRAAWLRCNGPFGDSRRRVVAVPPKVSAAPQSGLAPANGVFRHVEFYFQPLWNLEYKRTDLQVKGTYDGLTIVVKGPEDNEINERSAK